MDISWTELLVVAVVAIIVVGPKELPGMLRSVGRIFGQVRRTAREFQSTFNDALREAERQAKLDDVRKELDEVRRIDPTKDLRSTVTAAQKDLDAAVGTAGAAGAGPAMPSGAPAATTGAAATVAAATGAPASPTPPSPPQSLAPSPAVSAVPAPAATASRTAAVVTDVAGPRPAGEPAAAPQEPVVADGADAPRIAVGDRR